MAVGNRKLVWYDDFSKGELDTKKWCFIHGMHSPDLEYDNTERNVRVENGNLLLQVHKSELEDKSYCVAESLSTRATMAFKYGYLEMHAKIPFRHGAWPSFWLCSKQELKKAPYAAEIDIFEVFSSDRNVVVNLHKWNGKDHAMLPGGEGAACRAYAFKNLENLNNEFHTYGFEWNKDYVAFNVDGEEFAKFPIDESGEFTEGMPGMECFHDFQYILINNEVFSTGRSWIPEGAALTDEDEMPINYVIDYVKLYQDSENGEEIVEF